MATPKSHKTDSSALIQCYCPVCDKYLGSKTYNEVKVFKNDMECNYDWVFSQGNKPPKSLKRCERKKDAECGCGSCGR